MGVIAKPSSSSVVGGFALALGCPLGGSRRAFVVFVEQPVLLRVIQRIDHLRHQLVLLRDLKHCASVLVSATVVRCREDREDLTASEALEAVHDALMGPQDKATAVGLQEVFDAVGSELHDVASPVRVSDEVRLDAQVLVAVRRV